MIHSKMQREKMKKRKLNLETLIKKLIKRRKTVMGHCYRKRYHNVDFILIYGSYFNKDSTVSCLSLSVSNNIILFLILIIFMNVQKDYFIKKQLTHFRPMFPFYTPWKHQKTFGFLVFSGGIKWEHWPEMS